MFSFDEMLKIWIYNFDISFFRKALHLYFQLNALNLATTNTNF